MAVYANLVIDQGSDYFSTISVEGSNGVAYDLTGYSARGSISKTYNSVAATASFFLTITNPTKGEINMELPSSITTSMKPGRYVYDIEIIDSTTGDITRVVEGQVEVTPRAKY